MIQMPDSSNFLGFVVVVVVVTSVRNGSSFSPFF